MTSGTGPRRLLPLTLTAIGVVVYGDIGTSPLYARRECFSSSHSVPPTHENVLGVLSLIIYSLLVVISVNYVAIVMRNTAPVARAGCSAPPWCSGSS